jgi:hypothetical protein
MRLKDKLCYTCFLKDKGKQILFLFFVNNKIDLRAVLAYLLVLTQIKEIVIT